MAYNRKDLTQKQRDDVRKLRRIENTLTTLRECIQIEGMTLEQAMKRLAQSEEIERYV